ncbi:MAG TPA: ABC transporter permease [Fimbriimonas sp.]|nr:ABC transporter permease [Fimbriimonas sp.]
MKSVAISLIILGAFLVLSLLAFGIPVGNGLTLLYEGAMGDSVAISQSLVRSTPLLLTAIGIAIAWKAGAFSIGAEGQLLMGALFAAATGKALLHSNLGIVAVGFMLFAGVAGGALWAAVAAFLNTKRGVDIVISTILLNFIAVHLLNFAVEGPLRRPNQTAPLTDQLPVAMMLPKFSKQSDLHAGLIIAIIVAIAAAIYMARTRSGYFARVVGANPALAKQVHIDPDTIKAKALALSGAVCGLAGAIQYLGINGQISNSFSQGYGFLGIPVALIGNLNPLAILPFSMVFGGLFAATGNLSRFGNVGSYFVYLIQAGTVLGLLIYRHIEKRRALLRSAE